MALLKEAAAYLRMDPGDVAPAARIRRDLGTQIRRGVRGPLRREDLDAYLDGMPYSPPQPARVAPR